MNILFVINPVAGKNKSNDIISLIKDSMKKSNVNYAIKVTKAPKEATFICEEGLKRGYDTIVAVGGDGTINEVAQGILSTGYGKLGIIPMGTGNDLAKSLELPMNPQLAIDKILQSKIEKIDVGKVEEKFFLNVGSIGLDSEIVKTSEKVKKYFKGKISYVIALLLTLINYKSKKVTIELDNDKIEENILLVAIGNGRYYGGGMKICPTADLKDNEFEICVIRKISKFKLLLIFKSVFRGNHIKYKEYVKIYRSSKVGIKSKDNLYLNIDGEVFNTNSSVLFSMYDSKINIIT